jgi:hypothetical protein
MAIGGEDRLDGLDRHAGSSQTSELGRKSLALLRVFKALADRAADERAKVRVCSD